MKIKSKFLTIKTLLTNKIIIIKIIQKPSLNKALKINKIKIIISQVTKNNLLLLKIVFQHPSMKIIDKKEKTIFEFKFYYFIFKNKFL
jgi:hypothetical protein